MHLIGDPAAAPALRHAVDLYRKHDVLFRGRYDVEQFIETVFLVADTAKPVTAAAAPEILSMLGDAAAWAGRLPRTIRSPHPLLPSPQYYIDLFDMMSIQRRMAQWLEVLDAPQLAECHDRLGELYPRGPDGPLFWSKIQQALDEQGTP
ncbi:hypothetical protein ACWGKQ_41895 [Streptomyces sp. NPDC054770]